MTTGEKFELALVPVTGVMIWTVAPDFPTRMGVEALLLWASALLLSQGLVRDLWLLSKAKPDIRAKPTRRLTCMCIESTVGVTGVTIGLVLLGVGVDQPIGMNRWVWSLSTMIIMTVGFIVKDYVFDWSPFTVHRVKDHLTIVFTWKK